MSKELTETLAFKRWEDYKTRVLIGGNVLASLEEARNFVRGKQYAVKTNTPQPVINICKEAVDSKTAKITETKTRIRFITESNLADNNIMEEYYDFVQQAIDDREFNDRVVKKALIDGTALSITTYDKDTLNVKGKNKGGIKRSIIPLESWFFEEIWKEDIQDQKYLGYARKVSIKTARDMCESQDKETLDKICSDEMIDALGRIVESNETTDTDRVTIITMFERDKDGEVFYTVSTRFVDLIKPRYLSTTKAANDSLMELNETNDDFKNSSEDKNTLFEPPEKRKKVPTWSRYPVNVYSPEPIDNSFLGESSVTPLIQNQKVINYTYLLTTQIIQNNASPKFLVKEGALKGQKITNTPGQVLTDYSPYGYTGWGISQLSGGMGSVSNEIINFSANLVSMTRRVNGFDNLTADQMSSDVSGYAYQQYTRQMNLPLMIPQRRYWQYLKETARTDLLYFRYYIQEADFFIMKSNSEIELQETYRGMSQDLINTDENYAIGGATKEQQLPEVKPYTYKTITMENMLENWDIHVQIEEGIETSQASQGQRYEAVMQYAVNSPDMAQVYVENHPALDRSTKENFKKSFEAYKNDKIHQLEAQISEYQNVIQQQNDQLKQNQEQIAIINNRLQAQQKAFTEQNKTNVEAMNVMMNTKEQGEVKSNNARGIQGTSFDTY